MSQTGTGRVINDGHYHIHNVADKNLVLDITSTRNVVAMPMVNTNLGWSVKWSTNHYSITRIGETAVSYLQMDNNSKNINLGAPNATGNTQDWDVGVHRQFVVPTWPTESITDYVVASTS